MEVETQQNVVEISPPSTTTQLNSAGEQTATTTNSDGASQNHHRQQQPNNSSTMSNTTVVAESTSSSGTSSSSTSLAEVSSSSSGNALLLAPQTPITSSSTLTAKNALKRKNTFVSAHEPPAKTSRIAESTTPQQPIIAVVIDDDDDEDFHTLLTVDDRYKCPITREILVDPVCLEATASNSLGKVFYERKALVEWLKCNTTNPSTGAELQSTKFDTSEEFNKELVEFKTKRLRECYYLALLKQQEKNISISIKLLDLCRQLNVGLTLADKNLVDILKMKLKCAQNTVDRSEQAKTAIDLMKVMKKRSGKFLCQSHNIVALIKSILFTNLIEECDFEMKQVLFNTVWAYVTSLKQVLTPNELTFILSKSYDWFMSCDEPELSPTLLNALGLYASGTRISDIIKVNSRSCDNVSALVGVLKKKEFVETDYESIDEAMIFAIRQLRASDNVQRVVQLGIEYFRWRNSISSLHADNNEFGQRFIQTLIELDENRRDTYDLIFEFDPRCKELTRFLCDKIFDLRTQLANHNNTVAPDTTVNTSSSTTNTTATNTTTTTTTTTDQQQASHNNGPSESNSDNETL